MAELRRFVRRDPDPRDLQLALAAGPQGHRARRSRHLPGDRALGPVAGAIPTTGGRSTSPRGARCLPSSRHAARPRCPRWSRAARASPGDGASSCWSMARALQHRRRHRALYDRGGLPAAEVEGAQRAPRRSRSRARWTESVDHAWSAGCFASLAPDRRRAGRRGQLERHARRAAAELCRTAPTATHLTGASSSLTDGDRRALRLRECSPTSRSQSSSRPDGARRLALYRFARKTERKPYVGCKLRAFAC